MRVKKNKEKLELKRIKKRVEVKKNKEKNGSENTGGFEIENNYYCQ